MKSVYRFGIALTICLSGWALIPFVDLPRVAFGWEQFADAYTLLHRSLIPAAAVTEGAEGSFFQTDVDINNTAVDIDVLYEFWWLPRGAENSEPMRSEVFTLPGGQGVRIENVLGEIFGLQPDEVGAVIIAADSDRVIAMSRTYNIPADKIAGTFGQALPAVPAGALIPFGETRRIIFMNENADFRANLGCVNGTDAPVEISIDLYNANGEALETKRMNLGPWGNNQINRIFAAHRPVNGYAELRSDTPGAAYYCYGSMLDNGTSDPTTILPQMPSFGTTYHVPAAALASGAQGSFFQTELDINNAGPDSSYVLIWLPRGEDNSTPMQSVSLDLDAGESVHYDNVLSEVFFIEPDAVGALGIESPSESLLAMSRTFNAPPGKAVGTFGQALPGIQDGDMMMAGERRRIIFLSEKDDLRANVGCVNATDFEIEIDIEVYNNLGQLLAIRQMELDPWSNDQLNRILEPFSPTDGYVDVSSDTTGAMFYCYGSVLDNDTSDPTTILPQ